MTFASMHLLSLVNFGAVLVAVVGSVACAYGLLTEATAHYSDGFAQAWDTF